MNNESKHKNNARPLLVVSDGQGSIFEIPGLEMVGMSMTAVRRPAEEELIPMPYGSALFELPGRIPLGYDAKKGEVVALETWRGQPVYAAASFMAPAYSQIYRTAYKTQTNSVKLPLFAYTAVGWREGDFWVSGVRVDQDIRQDAAHFNDRLVDQQARQYLQTYQGNRLVRHLVENCVQKYRCPAAQNFVLGRWECPIPTSPSCNAQCVGCISKQLRGSSVPATQDRLTFVPTMEEIVQFAVPHLQNAPRAIVSFGQGCEGEPLVQGDLLEASIREIRKRTDRGTINLNTNASYPAVVERLCRAGLDSIRVSLNSAQEQLYRKYYNPKNYDFADVLETMRVMRRHQRWISLNYFIFPGLTDDPEEMEHLVRLVKEYRVDYIQMRNLNIDPEWYMNELGLNGNGSPAVGILRWMEAVRSKAPWIRFGYFNPPKEDWSPSV